MCINEANTENVLDCSFIILHSYISYQRTRKSMFSTAYLKNEKIFLMLLLATVVQSLFSLKPSGTTYCMTYRQDGKLNHVETALSGTGCPSDDLFMKSAIGALVMVSGGTGLGHVLAPLGSALNMTTSRPLPGKMTNITFAKGACTSVTNQHKCYSKSDIFQHMVPKCCCVTTTYSQDAGNFLCGLSKVSEKNPVTVCGKAKNETKSKSIPSDSWTTCSAENGQCACGSGVVRFGHGSSWFMKRSPSGSIACSISVFGDPKPGTLKSCQCRETTAKLTTGCVAFKEKTKNEPWDCKSSAEVYGKWNHCQNDMGGTCNCASGSIRFGAGLFWNLISATSVNCALTNPLVAEGWEQWEALGASPNGNTCQCFSPLATPDRNYTRVGDGLCRAPNCDVHEKSCRVNSIYKDSSSAFECKQVCNALPNVCVGYAFSDSTASAKNRCYIYGNLWSTKKSVWGKFDGRWLVTEEANLNHYYSIALALGKTIVGIEAILSGLHDSDVEFISSGGFMKLKSRYTVWKTEGVETNTVIGQSFVGMSGVDCYKVEDVTTSTSQPRDETCPSTGSVFDSIVDNLDTGFGLLAKGSFVIVVSVLSGVLALVVLVCICCCCIKVERKKCDCCQWECRWKN